MTSTIQRKPPVAPERELTSDTVARPVAGRWLAVLRILTGFLFLWAFIDKTFGLGYATPAAKAWISGGQPTTGFLKGSSVGPFHTFFNSLAGSSIIDWLFMLAMLGLGVALIAGIGLRVSAIVGSLTVVAMYLAEWPLAKVLGTGEPSHSNNPLVDYHLIYAAVLVVLALTFAGRTWGLGRIWEKTSLVQRFPWLR